MKYLALIRGINVGGKNLIKMSELTKTFGKCGFDNVVPVIQSGNIIFESNESTLMVRDKLEAELSNLIKSDIFVIIRTKQDIDIIMSEAPDEWRTPVDLRMYIAFIREPKSTADLMVEAEPKPGIDSLKPGKGVVYLSTKLSQKSHSGLLKLLSKSIYQDLTIRSYSTLQKIAELISK